MTPLHHGQVFKPLTQLLGTNMKSALLTSLLFLTACSIPLDKKLHMGAGAGIAGVSMAAGASWKQACGLSVLGGIAKEAYDSTGRGTVDAKDAIATGAAGCATAWVINLGTNKKWK
jgi:hypothetical protein